MKIWIYSLPLLCLAACGGEDVACPQTLEETARSGVLTYLDFAGNGWSEWVRISVGNVVYRQGSGEEICGARGSMACTQQDTSRCVTTTVLEGLNPEIEAWADRKSVV